jgi:hypothetical protein
MLKHLLLFLLQELHLLVIVYDFLSVKLDCMASLLLLELVFHSLKFLQSALLLIELYLVHHVLVVTTSCLEHFLSFLLCHALVFICPCFFFLESLEAVFHDLMFNFYLFHRVMIIQHQKAIVMHSPYLSKSRQAERLVRFNTCVEKPNQLLILCLDNFTLVCELANYLVCISFAAFLGVWRR